ncbi:hypothetical protein ACFL0S_11840 [Thermodesulfobacteriota bacterium]
MQSTIERISSEALLQAQNEVSKLIGAELELTLQSASLIKKQGFLEILNGRNSIIGLTMSGIYEGEGCLVTTEKSVVRLGGKMLMLSASELNEIISSATYDDEEELLYAFDEIAKCFVVSFLESFQNDNAMISTITCQKQTIADGRKEMNNILNYLSAEHTYYQISASINLGSVPVNGFSLLLPAFVLVCSEPFQKQADKQKVQSSLELGTQNSKQSSLFGSHLSALFEHQSTTADTTTMSLISHLLPPLKIELGNLLGVSVQITEKSTAVETPVELFQEVDRVAHLRTSLSIVGNSVGEAWLIAELTDATQLGLLLTEGAHGLIQSSLSNPFSADCQDGYNEICSIVVDVLSFVCQELSNGKLLFEKAAVKEYEQESKESYPPDKPSDSGYTLSSLEFSADGIDCGRLHLLIPAFVQEYLQRVEPGTTGTTASKTKQESAESETSRGAPIETKSSLQADSLPRVLAIEAAQGCASEVLIALAAEGILGDSISSAEELHKTDIESYQAIVIVVEKLDEIALGVVIKIKSFSSVPMLVAASQWTQKDVMKAMRYGVDDIVMLPVDSEELLQKIRGLKPLSV